MHYPRSGIVGSKGYHGKAIAWKQDDIAARRVVQFQVEVLGIVRLVVGLLEDGEVVAVEVYLIGVLTVRTTFVGDRATIPDERPQSHLRFRLSVCLGGLDIPVQGQYSKTVME